MTENKGCNMTSTMTMKGEIDHVLQVFSDNRSLYLSPVLLNIFQCDLQGENYILKYNIDLFTFPQGFNAEIRDSMCGLDSE